MTTEKDAAKEYTSKLRDKTITPEVHSAFLAGSQWRAGDILEKMKSMEVHNSIFAHFANQFPNYAMCIGALEMAINHKLEAICKGKE